ncbi:MAG TPA: heme-binding protein [Nevskiaceae bacterium]|nr:heme-binding protein [Nevskiaceae bacterium]
MFALVAAAASDYASAQQASALKDGERMVARCLDFATANKYPPLSVAVIDASGSLVLFKRQDGASSASADAALLKARTALRLNAPTSVLGTVAAADAPTRDAFIVMQMTTLPGGSPLQSTDGLAIGAVGVSGGEAEQDAECARMAAEPAPAKKK